MDLASISLAVSDPITCDVNGCISMAQFNANSLPAHLHLIKAHLSSRFYHVISILETWLHSRVPDILISLDDYLLIRNDRESR